MRAVWFLLAATAASLTFQANASPVVPGYERLSAAGSKREAGELLLVELGCANCHGGLPGTEEAPAYAGPDLSALGARLRPDFLRKFLTAPSAAHPGGRMPDLLPGENKDQAVESLAAYLIGLYANNTPAASHPSAEVARGQVLYHSIGCVACHEPEPGYQPPGFEGSRLAAPERSIPLSHVAEKYFPDALAKFLLNPLTTHSSGRMPAVPMNADEARALAAYLTRKASAPAENFAASPALAQSGQKLFAELNCAACHRSDAVPHRSAPPFAAMAPDQGCLSAEPGPGIPRYPLSSPQREALREALSARAQPPAGRDPLLTHLAALNCLACHSRDQRGGPAAAAAPFFGSNGEDLGDEGRFPPALNFAGAKFQNQALENILKGQGSVRPFMQTRMPGFGEAHARELARLLAEADFESLPPTIPPASAGRNAQGRQLAGNSGLNCIACHPMNGHRALGIASIDLATAPKRLRVEWFREHLLDPARFRPGTRMPSFWPDGKPLASGGPAEAARQIESIWVYLNELDQTRLPEGMEDPANFLLVPATRPIVFRTFMKGAGMHAIAAGFPERRHYAFDSRGLRLALLWAGDFLDAEATWDNRFTPLTLPLSDHPIEFPSGPALAPLGSPDEAWPSLTEHARFHGYRLNRRGAPTFLYELDSIRVEETLIPSREGFLRTLQLLNRGEPGKSLWFRAAAGKEIQKEANTFVINGDWRTEISGSTLIRQQVQTQELLVAVRFVHGRASLEQKILW